MKKLKYVIFTILIIGAAFLYAHIGKNNLIYDKTVDNSEYQPTGAVDKIEQTFICEEEFFNGIRAKCQIIGDVTGKFVNYTLIDTENNKTIATGKAPAEEVKNSKFYYFKFDEVTNAKGHPYKIIYENEGGESGIGFFYQLSTESETSLTVNENPTEGTLIIKIVTERFDVETFIVLLVFVLYVVLFIKFLYKLFK